MNLIEKSYNRLKSMTKGYYDAFLLFLEFDSPWFPSIFNIWKKHLRQHAKYFLMCFTGVKNHTSL